ncbi:MAG: type II toxin-antitoxin system RelE/ParE family toxin [Nanoarchaeota archaeon]|nr:type II toxin-antitoxin system RelE/ParE family toxin [Nanoarchaeota archaeon]
MYEIIVLKKAKSQLSKLPEEIRNRIGFAIEKIKLRPFSFVKRLVASQYFRLRVGDYRLILDIRQSKLVIMVIEVGHRRNVYKR